MGSRKILSGEDALQTKPPQLLVKCQAAAPEVGVNVIPTKERPIPKQPCVVYYFPTAVIDTSAPTCVTHQDDIVLKLLVNADPRKRVFYTLNPATLLPDNVFKAAMIKRYRIVNDIAHEVLPGASVLKRFREELGESSEGASVLKRSREELGELSEGASGLKRFCEELGESSEPAFALDPRLLPRGVWRSETINGGGAASVRT